MLGAVIGAGASLLGGIFGRKSEKKAIAAQNEYNKPLNVRKRAEEGGFNPLLFVGPGVGQQTATGGTNYMGAAIADAGMMLADSLSQKKEATAVTALQKQNKELADKVTALTLRPKVGGIYERRESVPSIRQALGVSDEPAEKADFDISLHSPYAGDLVGEPSDDLTSVQLATKRDVPAFRAFGHDFYGSGAFSTGQQVEDSVGEGPGTWVASPFIYGDAIFNETRKLGANIANQRWKQSIIDKYKPGGAQRFRPMASVPMLAPAKPWFTPREPRNNMRPRP